MSTLNSVEYYRARCEQELALAQAARNPEVAAIHREMAARYAELAGGTKVVGVVFQPRMVMH